jgi:cytochrome c
MWDPSCSALRAVPRPPVAVNQDFYNPLGYCNPPAPDQPWKEIMKLLLPLFAAALAATSVPAFANAELAQKKNCMACHAVDKKVVGPAYKEVAAQYAGQKDAVDKLSQKVMKGGVGVWGAVPMPANPQITEAEAKQLVQWVLNQK